MDDLLLKELGNLARREEEAERARLDERWDRLAAGTLTAEEEAELKALADSSPEAREAYAAFHPLGANFQARVVSAINSERASEAPAPEPREERPRVLPFRRIARRFEVWVGTAAAVAAGVFFLVRTPAPMLSSGYQATLENGLKENRGGETAPPNEKPVFGPDTPFNPEIGPMQPLEHPGKVKAGAYLSHSVGREDWTPLELEDKFEAAETGSIRLKDTVGKDIATTPGDWIFWTVVARGSLPKAPEVQDHLRAKWPQYSSWQDICDALQKEEKPPPAPSQVACVGFRTEGRPAP